MGNKICGEKIGFLPLSLLPKLKVEEEKKLGVVHGSGKEDRGKRNVGFFLFSHYSIINEIK